MDAPGLEPGTSCMLHVSLRFTSYAGSYEADMSVRLRRVPIWGRNWLNNRESPSRLTDAQSACLLIFLQGYCSCSELQAYS
jgi:hypothetical protein